MIAGAPVLVLRFADESVWRDCCDAAHMRRRWGSDETRMISRRLQQLEAMSALDELGLLPFDSRDLDDGVVEVVVSDDVVLVIEPDAVRAQEDGSMNTIVVTAVRMRSDVGQS